MKNSWKEFYNSIPDDGDRSQTLAITDVGGKVTINEKNYLEVFATDVDSGEEYAGTGRREGQGVLIPEDADIGFDPKTFEISGGRMSQTGNSYANADYNWNIATPNNVKTPIKKLAELIA